MSPWLTAAAELFPAPAAVFRRSIFGPGRRGGLLAAVIEAEGGECLPVQGDMTKPEDVQRLVEETLERFGRVDTVVNAGIFCSKYNGAWAVVKRTAYVCCRHQH